MASLKIIAVERAALAGPNADLYLWLLVGPTGQQHGPNLVRSGQPGRLDTPIVGATDALKRASGAAASPIWGPIRLGVSFGAVGGLGRPIKCEFAIDMSERAEAAINWGPV